MLLLGGMLYAGDGVSQGYLGGPSWLSSGDVGAAAAAAGGLLLLSLKVSPAEASSLEATSR